MAGWDELRTRPHFTTGGRSCAVNNRAARHAEKRGQLIRHLALADELQDGHTGYWIERALDEARSRLFKPFG
jgi:hypothetical protein